MKIDTKLPFEHCEKCKEFVLKVNDCYQIFNSGNSQHVIVVRCKNEWLCKQLKENLVEEVNAKT